MTSFSLAKYLRNAERMIAVKQFAMLDSMQREHKDFATRSRRMGLFFPVDHAFAPRTYIKRNLPSP